MADNITERDQLIMQWQQASASLANAKELELTLRGQVVAKAFPTFNVGVNNLELGRGYILKGTGKLNYNLGSGIDAALEAIENLGNEGAFIAERLVTWKPSLSISEYKKLDVTNPTHKKIKELIDGVLTITDGAPTLEVVEPKAK